MYAQFCETPVLALEVKAAEFQSDPLNVSILGLTVLA
jgi:hypothetical protein